MGFTLRILNGGHHWELTRPGLTVEWWPSSAKCVINKNWPGGVHVHDHEQLKLLVETTIRRMTRTGAALPTESRASGGR